MIRLKNLSIHIILILLASSTQLWSIEFNFEKINNKNGLSSDEIFDICQDKEGFIWIATSDGLNCYTGTEVINYRPKRNDENTLSSSNIKALCVSPDNKLWIAGSNQKIDILDRQSNTVKHLTFTPNNLVNSKTEINSMLCDYNGDIWLSTNRGVSTYSTKKKKFKDYLIQNRFNYTPIVYETPEGDILCGVWSGTVYRLNKVKDKFEHLEIEGFERNINIKSLLEDTHGTLWIGTWSQGLYRATKNNDGKYVASHSTILNENYPKENSFQIVYNMVQDKEGQLWLGTDIGLGIINKPQAPVISIEWVKPGTGINNFSSKDASTLLLDDANSIWIGTQGDGVSRFDPHNSLFTTYTSESYNLGYGSNIFSSFWYYKGELYTGVKSFGFAKYNIASRTFTSYKELPEYKGIADFRNGINTVKQCEAVDDRYLWMLTRYRGLIKYDVQERKVHQLPISGIRGTVNRFLLEKDRIWVGKDGGLMLFTRNPSSNDEIFPYTKTIFIPEANNTNTISRKNISDILRDKDGQLWISYFDGGLDKVYDAQDPKDMIFESVTKGTSRHLETLPIQTMYEDEHGNLWLGTSGEGLWLYRKNSAQFVNFSKYLGLENQMVFGIIEDDHQNLWISSNQGIYSFNILSTTPTYVVNYNADDGLQGNIFVRNSVCKSPDGSLIFGGYHGFNHFNPQEKQYNTYIPQLAFTKFEINRKPSPIAYSKGEKLIVGHKSTSFMIGFAALSYTRSHSNQYQYMLEGYDKNWIKNNRGNNSAIYGKLPAGEYTFKVKGANNNGVWNPKALEVGVVIKKSPFLTILAYIIYVLILVSMVWAYIYYSQRNFKLKQAYKEEQNERLREEKINQFKLKFFTNISHELLTPLSIISSALEQYLDKKPKEASALAIIQRNTNRLSRLINQLLDFRKVESDSRTLLVSPNDVNLHISSLKDNFVALCAKKDIRFIVEGDVTNKLYFDRDKLDKILHNILSNAFKHTPEGGTITLRYATYLNANNEILEMSVSDTGCGIPPELIDKIFERFYRIDDRKFESGAGIGLAFTKSLISCHKGSIKVENNNAGGALFTFHIPVSQWTYTKDEIARGDEAEQELEYAFADEMDEIKIPLRESRENNAELPKILLVEDNHDMRTIMRNYLSKYFEIYESENGVQGLESLNKVDIELVVSDIMMPEMDGLTFCRRLKNNINTSHIPVILTTAKRSEKNYIEGYEAQADSYITKPVNLQLLLVRIINLLEQRNKLRKLFAKEDSPDLKKININNLDQNLLDKVNQYISDNISSEDLTVVNLSKHVGISTSVLYRKVKSFAGMSPNEYIRNQRLNYSCELLRKGLSPSEVTYECGFSDPSYFGARFKKQFGITPKKYIESL